MSLRVKSRKLDNVVVIDMDGRLTGGEPQLLFRNTIRRFLDDGNNRFGRIVKSNIQHVQ